MERAPLAKQANTQKQDSQKQETSKKILPRPKDEGCESGFVNAPAQVNSVLAQPGRALDSSAQALMEYRYNYDFSSVKIHDDLAAAQSAHSISALAYTAGRHVVFGAGRYAPASEEGLSLIAHGLSHIIQQDSSYPRIQRAKASKQENVALVKMYQYTVDGKTVTLNEEEYNHEKAKALRAWSATLSFWKTKPSLTGRATKNSSTKPIIGQA